MSIPILIIINVISIVINGLAIKENENTNPEKADFHFVLIIINFLIIAGLVGRYIL